jgi:hypothetical protein
MTYLACDCAKPKLGRLGDSLGAFDLNSLLKQVGGASMVQVAETVATVPAVQTNRARAAAVVELGYEGVDFIQEYKPALFLISILTAIASGYALKRRYKVPEAAGLYSTTGLASVAMAWITRPDFMKPAAVVDTPAPDSNAPAGSVTSSALKWADARVAKLTAKDPGWEGRTLARLYNDIGPGTMDPAVQVILTKNSH